MKTTFVTAAIIAAVMGTTAFAQGMDEMGHGGPDAGMMMPDFATLDSDGDGQVTTAEVEARLAERFATADADASGGLSVAEMVAMAEAMRLEAMTAMMTERLARIDDNADGQVQATEFSARMPGPELMFDRLDTDNSGGISVAEYDAGLAMRAERGEGRGRDDNGGGWMFWRNGHDGGHHGGNHGG